MDAREALLTLLLTPGLGPTLVNRCVQAFGSAEDVLDARSGALAGVQGISQSGASKLRRAMDELREAGAAQHEMAEAAEAGVAILTLDDEAYPRLLKHIPDPPPVLWVRGELRADDALALGVVGARKCSHYGREQSQRFAYQCAQAGLCIVSGGAYGIDTAAHEGALAARGRTIAVIGSGLANPYPKENAALFDRIAEPGAGRGTVVSEVPMATPPLAEHFPRRNRIISGLSLGVLVIEAATRSGALITARLCVEEHGRELMAVPGRVDSPMSAGCHRMLREGWAKLVTNAADVLDGLGEAGQLLKQGLGVEHDGDGHAHGTSGGSGGGATSGAQHQILRVLDQPRTLDEVAAMTELPMHQVQAELTMLEVRAAVARDRGLFRRRA